MDENQNGVSMTQNTGGSMGTIIVGIIILAIVILVGLYFWGQRATDNMVNTTESIEMQDSSDETSSIEADLDATDIETLDAEMNAS